MTEPDEPALIRVLQGEPSPEELAALVVVVASSAAPGGSRPAGPTRSAWRAPERRLRAVHRHGPGRWRASAWPG